MAGALNTPLREGPPPEIPGGPKPLPVMSMPPPAGPQPAAPNSGPAPGPMAGLLNQQAQQPAQKPAPDTKQTIATLMHLQASQKEFEQLSQLPDVGKENVRPAIFDAMASMMAKGFVTLPQVMNEMRNIPADPPGQKQWILTHLKNAVQAQQMVLSDHGQAFPSSGDALADLPASPAEDDGSHADMMSGVAAHYVGRRR